MSKIPLVEGILNYLKENNIRFSMPGHKGRKGFTTTDIGEKLLDNFIDIDITEVEGVDNFHNAQGIIKEAQDLLSQFYGSKKSYFLVNGSTSGNLAMIFSSFDEGDKVIVERNCHKSIFNGIILRKLKPVYIRNKIHNKYNAPLSIDEEHFLEILENNKDAKGIIITYPNYYGICPNLKFIINEAKKKNMKVLIDSAHGAHFQGCNNLPESAVNLGADMVVMSAHKTLPSFTQTAYLHVNNESDIKNTEFYLKMFLSTSPSYMFMCSMDYARYYLQEKGENDYNELIKTANLYRKEINGLKGFHVLDKKDLIGEKCDIDLSRYIINIENGYSGEKLLKYLRKNKIQAEMNDNQNVVLIFSPFNKKEEFKRLYEILRNCSIEKLESQYHSILNHNIPKSNLMPYEVIEKDNKVLDIEESIGSICAEAIVPYPPGIPIINLGEIIDKGVIESLQYYLNSGVEVIGVNKIDNKIKVKVVWD